MTALGPLTFGLTSFINLAFNSTCFWYLLKSAILEGDILTFYLTVIPHGILEIPSIIIAGAAGFKIPYEIVRYLLGRKEQILTREDIEEYLMLALISVTLIILAAWIEANVTLRIAKAMLETGV